MEKKITSHVIKGLIIAGTLIAFDIVLQKIYAAVPDGTRYVPELIIVLLGVFAGCIIYSKQSGNNLSFGEVFSHGLKTTAVIAFFMALYSFVLYRFVYPTPTAAEMDAAVKAIQQQGNALHEEAVQEAATAAKNRWVIYVSVSIFASLIPGLIGSVAGGAVTKKNPSFKQ